MSQTNESATVSKSEIFSELNKASLSQPSTSRQGERASPSTNPGRDNEHDGSGHCCHFHGDHHCRHWHWRGRPPPDRASSQCRRSQVPNRETVHASAAAARFALHCIALPIHHLARPCHLATNKWRHSSGCTTGIDGECRDCAYTVVALHCRHMPGTANRSS